MTRMNCKLKKPDGSDCGVAIDYNPDTKKAKNIDGSDHFHPKKKYFTTKQAMPIESELELLGKISNVEERLDSDEKEIARLGTAIKAIVEQLKGQETVG